MLAPRRLRHDLVDRAGARLDAAEKSWSSAVHGLFDPRRVPVPRLPATDAYLKTPPTVVTWVFGADHACWDTAIELAPSLRQLSRGKPAGLRVAATALGRLAAALDRLPLPAHDDGRISSRVRPLLSAVRDRADLFREISRGVAAHPDQGLADRYRAGTERLKELRSALQPLRVFACIAVLGGSGSPLGPGAAPGVAA